MERQDLVELKPSGLYCPAGGFYIDPWAPVDKCVITHAHSDHAQPGSKAYLTSSSGVGLLKTRIGIENPIETVEFGQRVKMNDVTVSLHSAGHVLGSAQVRLELSGEVWVISSDYKVEPDPTCAPFELLKCDTFISESTFGLPIYRWRPESEIMADINAWWQANAAAGKCSIIFGYALGKAQRILAGLDPTIGPIYSHGAVEKITQDYRAAGVKLPEMKHAGSMPRGTKWAGSIVIAPPSAQNSVWMRQFGTVSTAFASGWMRIRGTRRRKSADKGFVLSDHADWDALNEVIRGTGAERVLVTHGYATEMVRWLRESGLNSDTLATKFEGELGEMQPGDSESAGDEENNAPGSGVDQSDAKATSKRNDKKSTSAESTESESNLDNEDSDAFDEDA